MNHVPQTLRVRIAHVRAGTRLITAIVAGGVTWLAVPTPIVAQVRAVAAWDGFAIVALVLTWTTIMTLTPEQMRTLAKREDPSRAVSLLLVLVGAAASLLAVLILLQVSGSMTGADRTRAVILAISAVILAWCLINTVFTLRYAHLYYETPAPSNALEFPGLAEDPDYLDFAYFAFVIGMTAQTADVKVRSRRVRRLALMHGLIAFAFNTAVLALSFGILTSLLQPE